MELREYQKKTFELLKQRMKAGIKRLVICSPTGSGKTVLFSIISKMATSKGSKILIITDRKQLHTQADSTLKRLELNPEFINDTTKKIPNGNLVVSMVETLFKRLSKPEYLALIQSFKVIIIDECHKQAFNKLFQYFTDIQFIIGFSATPYREPNKPQIGDYYNEIINSVQIKELIDFGFLANPKTYGVKIDLKGLKTKGNDYDIDMIGEIYGQKIRYTGAVTNYLKYAKGLKTIVFCGTIENSQELCTEFKMYGLNADHFDCYMSKDIQDNKLEWFKNTPDAILCNVGILTTGFDQPDIQCVLIYRPTKSKPLFLQMCGRGSRIAEGKDSFIILDFGENIQKHGFWQEDQFWKLFNVKKKQKECPTKDCPECGAMVYNFAKFCDVCGHEFEKSIAGTEEKEIVLKQLIFDDSIDELEKIRLENGYKPFWTVHKIKNDLNKLKEYAKRKGYKRGWAEHIHRTI